MTFTRGTISEVVSSPDRPDGLSSGQAVVANGDSVIAQNSALNKSVAGTAVVNKGAVSGVTLPTTAAIVTSTQELTGVTPSGEYVSKVTFTVVDGEITAIALS
jgi:hypothetical protein